MKEITQLQFDVLTQLAGVRAATDRSLARALRCELALVRSAIASLLKNSMIIIDVHGEITLAPAGVTHLNANGVAVKKPKEDGLEKLAVLDLPPSNETLQALAEMTGEDAAPDFYKAITEGDDQLAFNVRKSGVLNIENGQAKFTPAPEPKPDPEVPTLPGVDQIVFTSPSGDWGKVLTVAGLPAHDYGVNRFAEIPAPDRADFATLVRQGLARLNAQMGQQPITIENAALKVETLELLAESIGVTNEPQVYDVLRAIAQDLRRIADRSS
jgi:hypothetical protein